MKWVLPIFFALSGFLTQAFATNSLHVQGAYFATPTERYAHNIMGSLPAHIDLVVSTAQCKTCATNTSSLTARLPENLVFEDFAPRLIDLDNDGQQEILVVESDQQQGSRLAMWEIKQGQLVRGASSAFIGQRFRWLAPIGVADFYRNGKPLIAYVEKPHLDKVLRLVRREGNQLVQVEQVSGITNHLIGQETVQSRIEYCPNGPMIVALSSDAQRILTVQWAAKGHIVRDAGPAVSRSLPNQNSFSRLCSNVE